MYILPTPTHLEVVALGDSSDISPDQHLNYASNLDGSVLSRPWRIGFVTAVADRFCHGLDKTRPGRGLLLV